MSINEIEFGQVEVNGGESARRKRTPSKYAESIKELTKVSSKNFKRERNEDDNEDETPPTNNSGLSQSNLICILPSTNRKLKLSIMIKKNLKSKIKKSTSLISIEREKDKEKEKPKNVSLLDTLFQVVEQYKADEENKKEEFKPVGSFYLSPELPKREMRAFRHREEEEKYCKFYEKYRMLCQRQEISENEIVLI